MTNGRKACRSGERCEIHTVGELIYCAVNHSDPTPDQIAEFLNVRRGYLLDAANPDRDDTQFQFRLFKPLLQITRRFDLMERYAEMCGFVAYRLPDVNDDTNMDAIEHIGEMTREFGSVLEEASRTLADGRVSPDEAEKVETKSNRHIGRVMSFVALFKQKAGIKPLALVAQQERA